MRADLVEQRDGERAPFDDRLVTGLEAVAQQPRLLGPQRAGIDQQAAVAILGQPRQRIELDDFQAGALDRLDQLVGQPLR